MKKKPYRAVCPACGSDEIAMVNAVAYYDGDGRWIVETFMGNPRIECAHCNDEHEKPHYITEHG